MFKKLMGYILNSCGYIDQARHNTTIYENGKLARQVRDLELKVHDLMALNKIITEELQLSDDENKSLWDMLDEMKGSETFGKEQVKSMMEDLNDMITGEMMKDFKPIGEA